MNCLRFIAHLPSSWMGRNEMLRTSIYSLFYTLCYTHGIYDTYRNKTSILAFQSDRLSNSPFTKLDTSSFSAWLSSIALFRFHKMWLFYYLSSVYHHLVVLFQSNYSLIVQNQNYRLIDVYRAITQRYFPFTNCVYLHEYICIYSMSFECVSLFFCFVNDSRY